MGHLYVPRLAQFIILPKCSKVDLFSYAGMQLQYFSCHSISELFYSVLISIEWYDNSRCEL